MHSCNSHNHQQKN